MVQAIIMAGGEGSRLRPLTCDRPKPMVPMVNRPVMEHTVELLKKHGITDIGVTLQYMPQEIMNYFGNGSELGVSMNYFIEESPLGTAGSVKNSGSFLKDTFIVVSGDALTDFNLSEALDYHRKQGAIATLVLTPVEIPLEYGVVITGDDGRIRQFLEKPGWGEVFSDTVNTGIYILEPEVLNYIPKGKKFDFSKDLFPALLKDQQPLFGVALRGYWCDIGNLKQYQEAHLAVLDNKVDVKIPGILTDEKIYIGENCRIDKTAQINGPVIIGENCRIGKNTIVGPSVVLGDNCRLDDGATIKRSVLWNGSFAGKNSEIRGAVLCSRVFVRDRAAVYEGAVIGDEGILEEEVKIKPNTKIWPGKLVEKGSILDTHLIWGTKACKNLFGQNGVSGKINVNLTPECAAKIGAVFGTTLGEKAKVLLSSDSKRSSRMIKWAVTAGLASVGVEVLDGGNLNIPSHKHSVRTLGTNGGIHIITGDGDSDGVHLNFFSGDGSLISRGMERKIENLFEREDFQRSPGVEVGEVNYIPGLNEAYVRHLLNTVDSDVIKTGRYKILACVPEEITSSVHNILNNLGCEIINLELSGGAHEDTFSKEILKHTANMLAAEVVRCNAQLGLIIRADGSSVFIIDEKGQVLDDHHLLTLMTLIFLESSDNPVVAVPVTGSGVIEKMAEKRKGVVIRTKTSPVAFLNAANQPRVIQSQGSLNQFLTAFDGMSTVVRILEFMAKKRLALSEVMKQIPDFHITSKQTECPWSAKGKVIRKLIEENKGKRVELIDGVKVYHDNGWALVLPDAEEPRYNVYSEAFSYEFADSLADFYINRINQLKIEQ